MSDSARLPTPSATPNPRTGSRFSRASTANFRKSVSLFCRRVRRLALEAADRSPKCLPASQSDKGQRQGADRQAHPGRGPSEEPVGFPAQLQRHYDRCLRRRLNRICGIKSGYPDPALADTASPARSRPRVDRIADTSPTRSTMAIGRRVLIATSDRFRRRSGCQPSAGHHHRTPSSCTAHAPGQMGEPSP